MKPIEIGCLVLVNDPDFGIRSATVAAYGEPRIDLCEGCGLVSRYWNVDDEWDFDYCECALTRIDGYEEPTTTELAVEA